MDPQHIKQLNAARQEMINLWDKYYRHAKAKDLSVAELDELAKEATEAEHKYYDMLKAERQEIKQVLSELGF